MLTTRGIWESLDSTKVLFEESGEFDIYHASKGSSLPVKRPVSYDFNSIGVWFSSSKKYASMFGDAKRFQSPEINVKILKEPLASNFKKVFFDYDIAKGLYGEAVADELQSYSEVGKMTKQRKGFKPQIGKVGKALNYAKSLDNRDAPSEKITKNTHGSEIFRSLIFVNKPYLEKLQKKWESSWDGLLFYKSKIDGVSHDVWLIFDPKKHQMKPIER